MGDAGWDKAGEAGHGQALSTLQAGAIKYCVPGILLGGAAKGAVPEQLARGEADEAVWLAENGLTKNNKVWRPRPEEIDSATFRAIVGEAKYTAGGKPVGTIFDVTKDGFTENKSGSSVLDSSYQLRLQTYRSVTTKTPFSIVTTRPINSRFQQSLDFWGVNVVPPK